MKEIIAYEMEFAEKRFEDVDIELIPFEEKYYTEYERIYNECFYDMRKELDVKPYSFYSDYLQIKDKAKNIFLFIRNNEIVGSVACYENEIDDLIVNKKYQNNGIGQKLLIWAINHIRTYSSQSITLHVAKWNEKALCIYQNNGFIITRTEKIR